MLAEAMGVRNIKALPGCWEVVIDEQWWLAVNGHKEPTACSPSDGRSVAVPPYSVYVEFNGWPAGILNIGGDEIVAGAAANEDALIDAIKAKTAKVRGRS